MRGLLASAFDLEETHVRPYLSLRMIDSMPGWWNW